MFFCFCHGTHLVIVAIQHFVILICPQSAECLGLHDGSQGTSSKADSQNLVCSGTLSSTDIRVSIMSLTNAHIAHQSPCNATCNATCMATPHAWPPNKIAAILARRRDAVVQEDIQDPCLSILPAQRSARFVSVSDEFVPVGRDPSKWLEVLHIGLSS